MPDIDPTFPSVPESKTIPKKRTRFSFVWIIPLIAAAAGVWITVTKILSRGPEITIVFSSADGLEAAKTKVNYNGLDVGKLTAIHLSDDHKHVIATAEMDPKAKDFLVKDTKFWVVKPRMSGLNVSGLGTLLSGYYIGVEIGRSSEPEHAFVALETPPMVASDAPGRFFNLTTPELGSLGAGTPVYFRQLQAGQVVSYELDKGGQHMNVRVFVQAPYDQYVSPDTRFWEASGIDMSLTANGLHLQTESLMAILAGGVAFETPTNIGPTPRVESNTVFTLFSGRTEAFRPPPRKPHSYLVVFNQSVRGLEAGAPVTFSGVTIGEVTRIAAQFDGKEMKFTVPVTVTVDPERYGVRFIEASPGEDPDVVNQRVMDTVVSHGLRAQLKSGSLISGALYVAVDFFPDAPAATMNWSMNPPQLPTLPGSLEGIESSIAGIVKKLDQMQFKEISDDLRKALDDLDKTLVGARGTLTNTDKLLGSADKLLLNAGQLVAPNSALIGGVDATLQDVGGAARALRVLLDYLERHPESLIRGKTGDSK